jgi:hypothetical protein
LVLRFTIKTNPNTLGLFDNPKPSNFASLLQDFNATN